MSRLGALLLSLGALNGCAAATASQPALRGGATTVVAASTLDVGERQDAQPIHTPHPEYPESERAAATEARVIVRYEVDERGFVTRVRADGPAAFRGKALEALGTWRFKPATVNSVPRRSQRTTRFEFRVET